MQMKKLLPFLIAISLGGFSAISQAVNLLQAYKQAIESNPELRKTAADRDATFEKINEARSLLLPQLGLTASYAYGPGYRDANNINFTMTNGSLALTQTIFDMSKWRMLTLQEKTASVADITFQMSLQHLILDTATAYFSVLSAMDALSYTQVQKQALYCTLDQTTQRFKVGLVAITDVQNARSNYYTVLASEVTARNTLDNSLEKLRQVTGTFYPELASLDADRFSPQRPEAVNNLLKEAEAHNLSLLSARLSQDLARDQIRLAQIGYMPTINMSASTGITDTKYSGSSGSAETGSQTWQNKIVLSINLPLYSGGATNSQVQQAQYSFLGASESLESVHRSLVQAVLSSFNNVNASISSINAYKQAVVSAQSSMYTMEAGYQVGTRTIVDVLNATTMLYNAKQKLSSARYTHLINQLNIKFSLGTLNENDLLTLNGALGKSVSTSPEVLTPPSTEQNSYHNSYNGDEPANNTTQPARSSSDSLCH
jgi:outer membrane protein